VTAAPHPHDQGIYQVRFDWGVDGARAVGDGVGVVAVVDVLSFSTAVEVAVSAGLEVLAAAPSDAVALAGRSGAALARGRGDVLGPSPAWLVDHAAHRSDDGRVVLPSPNGSAISAALAGAGVPVVAACLRNRRAVAAWVLAQQEARGDRFPVAVIAAGELRPGGGAPRVAIEDLLGAGALIDALADLGIDYYSPEAAVASTAFLGCSRAVRQLITASGSGRELVAKGYAADVDLAVELDVSATVPVADGRTGEWAFRAAR